MARTWKKYERLWIALVAPGRDAGEFEPIGDPRMIAFGILGMCNWLALVRPSKAVSIDEIIDTYFRMLSVGLLPRNGATAVTRPGPRGA